MTAAEHIPDKDRPQVFSDEEDRIKRAMEFLEKENRSLKKLVIRLSEMVIRNVTGKK